ncbi:MAG: DUF2281 domain-containing protein [Phormidium tanganyikae FI6-MK23]|jgi:uncharacterized membrane protein|nr:DUF2281 domain-containing protein [Phormidium tanganyikae FI6-MK23]
MKVADKIYELVKTLPEDQASQVLIFIESLQQKSGANQAFVEQPERFLSEYAGILKDSPNFNEDPVELQKRMRDEKP